MITISTLCWFEESPENLTGGIVDGPDQAKTRPSTFQPIMGRTIHL